VLSPQPRSKARCLLWTQRASNRTLRSPHASVHTSLPCLTLNRWNGWVLTGDPESKQRSSFLGLWLPSQALRSVGVWKHQRTIFRSPLAVDEDSPLM
jgi:hypothetical protein